MKLFFILIFVLSANAFAQWRLPRFNRNDDTFGGLRAVWSCPTPHRGEMPDEREVEIFYDESGRLSFRPDIFRGSVNPLRALRNIFGGRRSSHDVGQCLRTFMTSLPQAISHYQQTQCNGLDTPVCTRAAASISTDTGTAIRASAFYRKYQQNLGDSANLLGQPQTSPQTTRTEPEQRPLPERRVEPEVVTETEQRPDADQTTEPVRAIPEEREPVTARTEARTQSEERARSNLLDYMVDNYARINEVREFSQHCPDLGNTAGVNAGYCRHYFNRNQSFLNGLSQRFTAVRGQPVPTIKMIQSLECLPQNAGNFTGIEDLLHSLDRKDDCDPLTNVGDYKLFRDQPGHAGFTSGNYLLKKTADNVYEAVLNLDFKENGGSLNSSQMLGKVQNCLSIASRNIRGPGGAKLNIRALSPAEIEAQIPVAERPRPDEIKIHPNGIAIDAGNFTGEADCATITHEVLHHLGLCDEYKETRTDLYYGMARARSEEWSCRVVPSGISIMKNHVEGWNAAIPRKFTCECVNGSCERALQSSTPTAIAQRKVLMAASPYDILGTNASLCAPVGLQTVSTVPEPDKAYANVQVSGGRLTFQHRSLFAHGNDFYYGRRNFTCQCPAGDSGCARALERAAGFMDANPQAEDCPLHTRKIGQDGVPEEGETTSAGPRSFTVVTTPRLPSLLYPNQFDKILTGSCTTSSSALFKTCSDYAYIPEDGAACANKPAECSDDNRFFGVSPQ